MRDYWQKSYNIDVNSPVIGVIEPKLVSKKKIAFHFSQSFLKRNKLWKYCSVFENNYLGRYRCTHFLAIVLKYTSAEGDH